MSKTDDELKHDYVAGCVRAFVRGKKNLNWVMSFIRGHHLPKEVLQAIIDQEESGANAERLKQLISACRSGDFL